MLNCQFVNSRKFIPILFLSLFFIGLGYIFIQPIFEGFDETAHYSRLRETFASPSSIFNNESYLDSEIVKYKGPTPYLSGSPPFEHPKSYNNFFTNINLYDHYLNQYKSSPFSKSFNASSEVNWQIQHPPLYYLLFSIPINYINKLSLVDQIFILRLFSYLVALTGLFFGIFALSKNREGQSYDQLAFMKAGLMIYPIIFPMFFLEFARIGNDSLCIFFVGLLAFMVTSWNQNHIKKYELYSLGMVLGLGLITKAFFIPITVAILLSLFAYSFRAKDKSVRLFLCQNIYIVLLPIIIIGGSWYLYKFLVIGDPGVGFESLQLSKSGGLIRGLKEHFNLPDFLRGMIVPIASFFWAGTWSLVRMPILSYVPLMLGFLWIFLKYSFRKRVEIKKVFTLATVLMFLFMYIGLCWHVLIAAALNMPASSPGWYLHILAPFAFPFIGIIFFDSLANKTKLFLSLSLLFYGIIFQFMAIWFHIALFGGCAAKSDAKNFVFNGHLICIDQFSIIMQRLEIISNPYMALISFFIGFILLMYLILNSLNFRYSQSN